MNDLDCFRRCWFCFVCRRNEKQARSGVVFSFNWCLFRDFACFCQTNWIYFDWYGNQKFGSGTLEIGFLIVAKAHVIVLEGLLEKMSSRSDCYLFIVDLIRFRTMCGLLLTRTDVIFRRPYHIKPTLNLECRIPQWRLRQKCHHFNLSAGFHPPKPTISRGSNEMWCCHVSLLSGVRN